VECASHGMHLADICVWVTIMKPRHAQYITIAALIVLPSLSLHGCDVPHIEGYLIVGKFDVATHSVPQWRKERDYWHVNGYKDPTTNDVRFNSCMNPTLMVTEICSGHGKCMPFDPDDMEFSTYFCQCDPAWAGIECKHRRKSQLVAWVLSLFFGPLAFDEIYLGMPEQTIDKLFVVITGAVIALSGNSMGFVLIGIAWLFDVVRIGLSAVRAKDFRVEEDLPRLPFAVLTILFFCGVALLVGLASAYRQVLRKRRAAAYRENYASNAPVPRMQQKRPSPV